MTKTQRDALEAALRFTERKELDRAMVRKMLQEALAEPDSTECFAVPVGWQLVPIEATREMCEAGNATPVDVFDDSEEGMISDYSSVYKAMLSAAPKP
jgi:hypothetical protein